MLGSVAKLLRPAVKHTTCVRSFHKTASVFAGQLSSHRYDPKNTTDTPFEFNEANWKDVESILAKYPDNYKQSAIIPLLDLAQRQCNNFLPVAAMDRVAEIVGVPAVEVYETASFYTMFNREPVGKYFIQLCGTTPCMVCGSEEIKKTIEKELGIKNGETTADGKFTLLEVECLGACANAPMIQLNDDFYECLTPESMKEILDACARDAPPAMKRWGSRPMNGQLSCEGPAGKTTLTSPPSGPQCRELPKNVDPADVKRAMNYD